MELEHHIKAKAATDAILRKFKDGSWTCGNKQGVKFYRINTFSDFPAPDATFADEGKNFTVSFEFKPPTETKRGILTGLGQSIAYLQRASISYLISPEYVEGFDMKGYLENIYKDLLRKVPVGLITYNIDDPTLVDLVINVKEANRQAKGFKKNSDNRYWAKHQDLPLPLFFLILHYYYLQKTGQLKDRDPYAACWEEHMAPKTIVDSLSVVPTTDIYGNPIKTMKDGDQYVTYCKDILARIVKEEKSEDEKKEELLKAIVTHKLEGQKGSTDNYYKKVRRYILAFFKQIHMINSCNEITDSGLKLHQLGLTNGVDSKLFRDYFAKEVLITGCHFDLIVDFDRYNRKYASNYKTLKEFLNFMESEYEKEGHIKRNPHRKADDNNHKVFLQHERTLWKYLDLMEDDRVVNWKRIIEVCTLPDL